MSNLTNQPPNPAAATEPPASVSPDAIVQNLRTIREQIALPEEVMAPSARKSRLAHVDADFVQAAINAAGVSPAAQMGLGRTDAELRQEIDAAVRWSAVGDELRALLRLADAHLTVRRQLIGLAALQTYKICVQLVRDPRHAHLASHIAEMKRLNKFGRARRKASKPAATIDSPKTQ
jgi:hypothetical protein